MRSPPACVKALLSSASPIIATRLPLATGRMLSWFLSSTVDSAESLRASSAAASVVTFFECLEKS